MIDESEVRNYVDDVGILSSGDLETCLGRRMEIVGVWANRGVRPPTSLLIRSYPGQDQASWLVRECTSTRAYKLFRDAGFFDRDIRGHIPVYANIGEKKVFDIRVLIDEDFLEKGVLLATMVMKS